MEIRNAFWNLGHAKKLFCTYVAGMSEVGLQVLLVIHLIFYRYVALTIVGLPTHFIYLSKFLAKKREQYYNK